MERIAPARWNSLPGINLSGKAFIARWLELFDARTLDTYRVRHLNVRVALEELSAVISDVGNGRTHAANVKELAAEALSLLKTDPIVGSILPRRNHYLPSFVNPRAETRNVDQAFAVLVEQILDVLSREYRGALLYQLVDAIDSDDVPGTLARTEVLASDLIWQGYDARELRRYGHGLLQQPTTPFRKRLVRFIGRLDKSLPRTYKLAYRIDFRRAEDAATLPQRLRDLLISPGALGGEPANAQRFFQAIPTARYAIADIEAIDPYAACRSGLAILAAALDSVQFAIPRMTGQIFPAAQAISPHAFIISTMPELLGPMRLARGEFPRRTAQVEDISNRNDIGNDSKVRLTSALRYLREGLADSTPHGQFLNYWIALESIVGSAEAADIGTIRARVPRLIALGYPRRLIGDLCDSAELLQLPLSPGDAQRYFSANRTANLIELWKTLNDEPATVALCAIADQHPLFQIRIRALAATFRTKSMIAAAIERNAQDVTWHLQRMYRLRNAIVHGGYTPLDLTHLASHLATYVWAILRAIVDDIAQPARLLDVDRAISKREWIYARMLQILKEQTSLQQCIGELLEPTILWPTA